MPETWLPVPGFEGLYEVSDLGRVRSLDRVITCSNGQLRQHRGRVLRAYDLGNGRWQLALHRDGVQHTCRIYRLVAAAFLGPPPAPGMEVCHRNGNSLDDRLVNLRWDTRAENNLDQVRHGTHSRTVRTHCPRKHLLQAPNITARAARQGRRDCKACHQARSRVAWASRHGMSWDFQEVADNYYARSMASITQGVC